MFAPVTPTVLAATALAEAGAIQARAFFDDPLFEFVFPDPARRQAAMPWLMQIGVRLGYLHGHVHTTEGQMLGHAVWLSPGKTSIGDEQMAEAGFVEPEQHMDEAALQRFGGFMEYAAGVHHRLLSGPHWCLLILGVDPPHQGNGVGGGLLQPTLARADAAGLPCYLETAKERNLGFYQRHGFEVAEQHRPGDGAPMTWMMIRPPK